MMQNIPEPHAPRPASKGMSGATIALIVLGILGVGAFVLCAGFYFLVFRMTSDMNAAFENAALEMEESFAAAEQIAEIDRRVGLYAIDTDEIPTTAQGLDALLQPPTGLADPASWQGPYVDDEEMLVDPWGNPYQYRSPGRWRSQSFDLWSYGPDGVDDTGDDIRN